MRISQFVAGVWFISAFVSVVATRRHFKDLPVMIDEHFAGSADEKTIIFCSYLVVVILVVLSPFFYPSDLVRCFNSLRSDKQ